MTTTYISISLNSTLFIDEGFQALIGKLIVGNSNDVDLITPYLKEKWCTPSAAIDLELFNKKDFNAVVEALEKGRKYLDTLITEEQQEEFVEDYIGVLAFDDLKYWTDETIRHCYQDPRYEAQTH